MSSLVGRADRLTSRGDGRPAMIMVSGAMTRAHKTSGHSVATIAETMSAPTATYSCAAAAWGARLR
jgi:hypothetical protein